MPLRVEILKRFVKNHVDGIDPDKADPEELYKYIMQLVLSNINVRDVSHIPMETVDSIVEVSSELMDYGMYFLLEKLEPEQLVVAMSRNARSIDFPEGDTA